MKHETCNMKHKIRALRRLFYASCFTFHEKGFTLIEILISIAIIGTLSSVVMVNIGFGNRQQNLLRAAQLLALDIRRAQNLSLAPTDSPTCVYGLNINSATRYFVYFDRDQTCANGHRYVAGSPSIAIIDNPGITLKNSITIDAPFNQDIAFEAPEPITYINGAKDSAGFTITLRSPDNTTKTVTVNRFGQVEIQ